jgi:N-acetylglucosaminyldiphosphoundecaprenol N-acetyl-beta-D-mannosaminyltransferase
MKKYFNVNLQFNHTALEKTIEETSLNGKGYCCFVDHTLLVTSFREKDGKLTNILNSALANSCDGSYIAMMANLIYKKQFRAYNGPELFNKYIYFNDKQCVIGNTKEVFDKIVLKVSDYGGDSSNLHFIPLPYLAVNLFDYDAIAEELNKLGFRFIWVSLGAPK